MIACDMAEKIIIKEDGVLGSVKGCISSMYRKYCCQSMALVRPYVAPNYHPHSDKWVQTEGWNRCRKGPHGC